MWAEDNIALSVSKNKGRRRRRVDHQQPGVPRKFSRAKDRNFQFEKTPRGCSQTPSRVCHRGTPARLGRRGDSGRFQRRESKFRTKREGADCAQTALGAGGQPGQALTVGMKTVSDLEFYTQPDYRSGTAEEQSPFRTFVVLKTVSSSSSEATRGCAVQIRGSEPGTRGLSLGGGRLSPW